jgi:hypothetical protein
MLTELLDTLDSDVIKIDKETGFYSIEESGSIDATEFDVESFTIEIDPHRDVQLYDFNLYNLGNDFEIPDELEGVLPANSYAYVLEDEIDENIASFDIEEEVPAEVLAIKRVTFKKPVLFTVEVDVSLTERADEFSVFIDNLHIHTDKDKRFYVEVPEYVKFADLDTAIKDSITANPIPLTDAEKASACDWLGAVQKWKPADDGSATLIGLLANGVYYAYKLTFGAPLNNAIPCYTGRGTGNNVLGTGTPVLDTDCANKKYVDDLVGDIETALDNIIALQNSLIGGGV